MAEEKAAASPEIKKEEKQETLEEKVSASNSVWGEIKDFGRKALTIGTIAAAPLAFDFIEPAHTPRAQVFTYTVSAGKATANIIQKKPALEGLLHQGTLVGPVNSYAISSVFHGLDSLEEKIKPEYGSTAAKAIKGGAWWFVGQPAVVTAHTALNYGLGSRFRENWWPTVKRAFYILGPPSIINVLGPWNYFWKLAISGALSFGLGLMTALKGEGSIKNLYNAINPFSYASAGYSLGTKAARNTFSYSTTGIYSLGSGIREFFSSFGSRPKATTEPKANPEPQPEANAHYMKAPSKEDNRVARK